jgi:hypothetical protein
MEQPYMEDIVWERFRRKLDDSCQWPSTYVFKFIVPYNKVDELINIFGNRKVEAKESTEARYVCITSEYVVQSSFEVVEMYKAASKIEGLIAL